MALAGLAVTDHEGLYGAVRFYQRCGYRMLCVVRDAFIPATGYVTDELIDGIPLRDQIWFDLTL